MLIKKITTKLGYALASIVLMTAQMTPFFVFGGQVNAEQLNTVSDHCTTGDMLGIKVDTGAIGVHVVDPVTVTIANNSSTDKTEVTNVVGDSVTITKVVVKGGSVDGGHGNGNAVYTPVFDYPLAAPSNSGGNQADISHVIVCYDQDDVEPELVTLRLKKTVINDDGGTLNADQFGISIAGFSTPVFGNPMSTSGDTKVYQTSSAFPELDNEIVISEVDTPNYSEGTWSCDNGVNGYGLSVTLSLESGDDVTCEITNNDIPTQEPALPYVRISYICKANFDGTALAWNGSANEEVPVNNGDYIWRFRYESANSDPGSPASVDYSTNFLGMNGDLDLDEIEFQTTASGAAGVKVSTVLDPNLYNGTASSNETLCEELETDPTVTISKFVNNNNSGNTPATEFPVRLDGNLLTPGDLMPGAPGNTFTTFETVNVEAGVEFDITEDATTGYKLRNITCKTDDRNLTRPFIAQAGEEVKCNVVNEDLPDPTITATKIVCVEESLLPNWGNGGPNITALTAIEYADKYDGCELEEGWIFEYAFNNQSNPGDNIEEGGAGWTPFGPTNSDGEASVVIEETEEVSRVWIREQLKNGYLGFTYNENNKTNIDSISAELYCNEDVLNYDNFDYISNPQYGAEYYCVAWNVKEAVIRIHKEVVNNENGTKDAEDFEFTVNGEDKQNFAEEGEYVELSVKNGEYTIEEVPVDGYSATYDGCVNIVAVAGNSYDCYVKNEADKTPPKVYVTKYTCEQTQDYSLLRVVAEYCDDNTAFDFEIYNNEQKYAGFSLSSGGTYDTGDGLETGSVEVVELEKNGWSLISSNCYYYDEMEYNERSYIESIYDSKIPVGTEFTAENGVTYYCEFYNEKDDEEEEEKFGEIVVTKFNDLNNNGAWDEDEPTLEGWEINVEGVVSEVTDGEGTATFNGLAFGDYIVTETMQDGWVQTVNSCNVREDGIPIESEIPVECYIGNYKTPSSTPGVLGASTTITPAAVLATTGDSQSTYMFATGLTLIAATIVTSLNKKKATVSTK